MAASYTCRQCLVALRRTATSRQRTVQPWRSKSTLRHVAGRNISTTRPTATQVDYNQVPIQDAPSPPGLATTQFPSDQTGNALLKPNNLFHPFSKSPSADIRRRATYINQHAYCPHPEHRQTRLPTAPDDHEGKKPAKGGLAPAHAKFECPDCGIPIYCSEAHWAADYENHVQICDTLREINQDDHDLRSGRFFQEFEYPGEQYEEAMVNMMNWDTFLYSREFAAIDDERSLRQATRLLTYPVTIGSVLHELSPYNIRPGNRLTAEGLRSMSGRCRNGLLWVQLS